MTPDVQKIRALAERVTASEGLTLVDVELKGGRLNQLLRIYIDKLQGVSHADCAAVSEQVSAMLDVEDLFPGPYTLEVSSPGLDRKLVKASDYRIFKGRLARLVLRGTADAQKVLEGRLLGLENGRVRLDLGGGAIREVKLESIAKARLLLER
ncbi:MAG: ribosome maturation factor RimP [Terriglobia bacterium]